MSASYEEVSSNHPKVQANIPVVNLSNEDNSEIARKLRSTCMEEGFFYLEGTGVPDNLLDRVMQQSKKFFQLPVASKDKIKNTAMSRGYTAMEEETLDPARQTKGDTKEGFYIGAEVPENDPRYNPAKLMGPNSWPTRDTAPEWTEEDCQTFRSVMEEYFEILSSLGFRVTQLLALALELDMHYFDKYFEQPMRSIRMLHYSNEKSTPDKGIFACGAHSDYGMITLLLTDDQPGLQIKYNEKWISVPPRPNAFIVNLGDMLERWTNGMFRSTMHRVLTSGEERYSIPFFYEPNFDALVECVPTCCSEENPPKYPPITSGQHLLNKYKETHADFKPND